MTEPRTNFLSRKNFGRIFTAIFILVYLGLLAGNITLAAEPKQLEQLDSPKLLDLLSQSIETWPQDITTDNPDAYATICRILSERHEPKLLLKSLIKSSDPHFRTRLISQCLYQMQSLEIVKTFRSRLREIEDEEHYYMANYLAKTGDTNALDILNRHYGQYPVTSLQWACTVELFGIQRYKPATQNLIISLDAASLNIAENAGAALHRLFPDAPGKFESIDAAKHYFHLAEANESGFFQRYSPTISVSAKGWTLKPKPSRLSDRRDSTILINPKGEAFNIGPTPYPDIVPSNLWILRIPELNARFLLIHTPPVASGAVDMPVIYLTEDDKPILSATIRQRLEIEPFEGDTPDQEPHVFHDGNGKLRDLIFKDSDGDGIPELVENDFWKERGTVTYYRFTEARKFVPLWRENWRLSDEHDGYDMISRIKFKATPPR